MDPESQPQKFKLSFAVPEGWRVPEEPAPPGGVRVTVNGAPASDAPAVLMVRAVDKLDDSFESYCAREFEAMRRGFGHGTFSEPQNLPVGSGRSQSLQALEENRGAIVTILERPHYFVWLGIVVTERAYLEPMPVLFCHALASLQAADQASPGAPS